MRNVDHQNCANCAYSALDPDDSASLVCRKEPPDIRLVSSEDGEMTALCVVPHVGADAFCSHFKHQSTWEDRD